MNNPTPTDDRRQGFVPLDIAYRIPSTLYPLLIREFEPLSSQELHSRTVPGCASLLRYANDQPDPLRNMEQDK